MSRYLRFVGRTGYMHIVKRGINHQDVFLDEKDYKYFTKLLLSLKNEMGFDIIAYCLMSNHIHLLLFDKDLRFSKIVQRLFTAYALYFNKKYERTGSLFEGRFSSKVVDSEAYLITAVRYIHNNPVKAGICVAEDYRWSSYSEYISDNEKSYLCNPSLVLSILGGRKAFVEFSKSLLGESAYETVIEMARMEGYRELSDSEIAHLINNLANINSPFLLQRLNKDTRDEIISKLRRIGVSQKQIARVTGMSIGIIKKVPKGTGTKVPTKK